MCKKHCIMIWIILQWHISLFLSPSGGILQGDRYRMDVELKNNAISHITTQGATRIYKMESNYATHLVTLT